jgi:hypothetical protein
MLNISLLKELDIWLCNLDYKHLAPKGAKKPCYSLAHSYVELKLQQSGERFRINITAGENDADALHTAR